MTEEKYWEIWDNITEVRFGSDVDTMDEPDELDYADKPWEGPSYDEPDITDDPRNPTFYDDGDVAEIIPEEDETLESYIERRILEEDKRDFCIAFHPNHVNKDDCTEPFTKP